jgi:hypothetical protein
MIPSPDIFSIIRRDCVPRNNSPAAPHIHGFVEAYGIGKNTFDSSVNKKELIPVMGE